MRALLDAPDGLSGGFEYPAAARVGPLTGTPWPFQNYVSSTVARTVNGQRQSAGPCLAVVKLTTGQASCVESMNKATQNLERFIHDFRFAGAGSRNALVD